MAARYWVGGAGTWSSINTTNWSATSGGAGGASIPTSADTPIFDSNSGSGSVFFTNSAVTVGSTTLNNANITLQLAAAFTTSGTLTVTAGTFTTDNYNVTASELASSNTNVRTINLGSSTVTLSGTSSTLNFLTSSNLTFNAGTSSIVLSSANAQFIGGGKTFYNVSFTSRLTTDGAIISGANTFQNLSLPSTEFAGIALFSLGASQVINGTLTLSAGTNGSCRTFLYSQSIGTTATLTCNAVSSLQDIDFRDIAFAGNCVSGGNLTGTRLGDCKGNSGITFGAGKTVYWRTSSSANWGATTSSWSLTSGGTATHDAFPLAQDTAKISFLYPSFGSTITINGAYNIGTLDMGEPAITLACTQRVSVYGNWIGNSNVTMSGGSPGKFTFAGRGSQTLRTSGGAFTQAITIDSPGGTVTLQNAFSSSASDGTSSFQVLSGTFNDGGYNFTMSSSGSGFRTTGTATKSLVINGVWSIGGETFSNVSTGLTVSGAGTIRFTSSSNLKQFVGAGIQTWPTIAQAGTGTLTITGSNRFANITNTAIGRVQFTGGTTNQFDAFNLNGSPGNLLQVGSSNTTSVSLKKSGSWSVGANSTDGGNNTGLSFTAGSVDYLSISRVNGILTSKMYLGPLNVASFYYGSTPVSAIYYGAIRVF